MRATRVLLLLVLLAACDKKGDAASDQRPDPSLLTNSRGEVALTDGGSLDYVITSERYKQWDAAQRAMSKSVAKRFGQLLNPRAPSEQSINRAVAYLESQPAARQAVERTGMTVRDFVVMTVALEQQMQLAKSRGADPSTYSPDATMDSGYLPVPPVTAAPAYPYPEPQPQPYPQYPPTTPPPGGTYPSPAPSYPTPSPAYPAPAPTYPPTQPSPRRADSMPADTITRPAPRETSPRRDSLLRRDTLPARRDTIVPPRSDTSASPPDSVSSR